MGKHNQPERSGQLSYKKSPFGNGVHSYDGKDEFSSPKGLEKPDKTKYNLFEAYGTVAVRSLLPANVERIGQVSGKQYYFWSTTGH
jgi:hypothetical protein